MSDRQRLASEAVEHRSNVPQIFASKRIGDSRGWFCEAFNARALAQRGIQDEFVQDNQSFSASKGTIRGLHFQVPPFAQAKIVRVLRGGIIDVVVDVRRDSPTYGQFVSAELTAENGHQLFVPEGFAHGFCTIEDNTEILYKVSEFYSPTHEGGIRWDDPQLNIPWPVGATSIVVSGKDARLPFLRDWTSPFAYTGSPLGYRSLLA
jgi:dTDP-4-dehydrorhamnose 3,5-epimerase